MFGAYNQSYIIRNINTLSLSLMIVVYLHGYIFFALNLRFLICVRNCEVKER